MTNVHRTLVYQLKLVDACFSQWCICIPYQIIGGIGASMASKSWSIIVPAQRGVVMECHMQVLYYVILHEGRTPRAKSMSS